LPGVATAATVFGGATEQTIIPQPIRANRLTVKADALHPWRALAVAQGADLLATGCAILWNRPDPTGGSILPTKFSFLCERRQNQERKNKDYSLKRNKLFHVVSPFCG
jgi:hypothetical protein